MSGLRRTSGLCWLVVSMLLCFQPGVAGAQNHTPPDAKMIAVHRVVTVSPELQGDSFMVRRRYEAAIDAYRRDPNPSAVVLNKIGIAYHHMLAFEEARKYYERALTINPHYAEALNNLGAVYYSRHDFAQAERAYKEALLYHPEMAVVLSNLGTTYFADNKNKLGMAAYQRALVIDPNVLKHDPNRDVEEGGMPRQAMASDYYLAKICAAEGKMPEAIAYLQKALDSGFHNRKQLMRDKEFSALRSTPEFQRLMIEHMGH